MVPGETFSRRAIALFDKPWATRRMISRSRSVSTAGTFSPNAPFSSLPAGARSGRGAASLRDCSKVSGLARIEIALQVPAAIAVGEIATCDGCGEEDKPGGKVFGIGDGEHLRCRHVRKSVLYKHDVGC